MSYVLLNNTQHLEISDGKLFKICNTDGVKDSYRDSIPKGIRSYIDLGSAEFCFGHGHGKILELTREECTFIAWEKLLHLYLAFDNHYNIKLEIKNHVAKRIISYPYYEKVVKISLAAYIDLLRNGGYYRWGSPALNYLIDNLTLEGLVDLLESEIKLRVFVYNRNRTNYSILEFAELKFDYSKLSRKFGIEISQDKDITKLYSEGDTLYPNYLKFIDYIITDEETRELQQKFIRETMILG